MKKTLYSSLALGAVLGLASCASDEPLGNRQNDGSVTFTVALPEMGTRAFGDAGTINCNELLYTVYDAEGNNIILPTETKTAFGQGVLTDNVTLQLVANQEYKIVFYAHNNGSQFSTYTDGKLTVDYTKANINSEIDDAFYVAYPFTADGTAKTVTLTRPFAQLNIGTDDLGEAAVQNILANITSTLTVSQGLKNSMDLIAGTTSVEGTLDDVTFTPAGAPAVNTDFPVTGYSNLLSVYLLVPAEQDMIDATYVLKNGEKEIRTLNLAATPVRMNYRTNVYGSLLTTQQPFNVEIEPNFNGVYNPLPWDGKTVTRPVIDETSKTVTVSAPSDFAGFIEMVNGKNGEAANNFEGYTVSLTQDIDFGGHVVTPIADGATRSANMAVGKSFKGVIDGGNNTIKNFIISNTGTNGNLICGFVTNLNGAGAALKNIKFENVEITSAVAEQTGIVGIVSNGATVENVHVLSGTITGTEATGGIVGRVIANGTITGCSNAASIHAKKYNAGGIVGAAYYTKKGQSMRIENCTNSGSVVSDGVAAGGIAGLSCAFINKCTNEGEIECRQNSAGGIAGTQQDAGGITGCENRGNVKCVNATLGAGGIVGWVRYPGATLWYPNKNVIEVTGCKNYGNVSLEGGYGVGGIVGLWYNMGKVGNCLNEASSISGSSMVAGIVGGSQFTESTPGLEDVEKMLYIADNVSTTTLEQMTGSLKALIVYINSPENVTLSGNTPSQE